MLIWVEIVAPGAFGGPWRGARRAGAKRPGNSPSANFCGEAAISHLNCRENRKSLWCKNLAGFSNTPRGEARARDVGVGG